jgi:(S)-2-hydroxy-acid oxidase
MVLVEQSNAARLKIRPRVLRDVSRIDTSTRIFDKDYPYPISISPSAMHQLAHKDGELATSRAVASQGLTLTLSTFSTTSLENVIKAGKEFKREDDIPHPEYWMQLYCFQNRTTSESLVRRAEAAGYQAVVLTVDTPYLGRRHHELRNKFELPANVRLGNFAPDSNKAHAPSTLEDLAKATVDEHKGKKAKIGGAVQVMHGSGTGTSFYRCSFNIVDPSISWEETIPWLKSITSMKIILKVLLK